MLVWSRIVGVVEMKIWGGFVLSLVMLVMCFCLVRFVVMCVLVMVIGLIGRSLLVFIVSVFRLLWFSFEKLSWVIEMLLMMILLVFLL